jgi:hypothetical protein
MPARLGERIGDDRLDLGVVHPRFDHEFAHCRDQIGIDGEAPVAFGDVAAVAVIEQR